MSASVVVKGPCVSGNARIPWWSLCPTVTDRRIHTYMQASANFVYYSDRVKIIPEYLNPSPSSSLIVNPFLRSILDAIIRYDTIRYAPQQIWRIRCYIYVADMLDRVNMRLITPYFSFTTNNSHVKQRDPFSHIPLILSAPSALSWNSHPQSALSHQISSPPFAQMRSWDMHILKGPTLTISWDASAAKRLLDMVLILLFKFTVSR